MKLDQLFSNKKILLTTIVAIVAVAGVIYFVSQDNRASNSKVETTSSGEKINDVDYGPPTDDEQTAGDDQKQQNLEEEENQSQPTTDANVVIADANQYGDDVEVRAFVSNRIDSTGTCKLTITKSSFAITRSSQATADASTTQCTAFTIPRSEFNSGGKWDVTVSYSAGNASGQAKTTLNLK